MLDCQLWEWLLPYVCPLVLSDQALRQGVTVTATELAARIFPDRDQREAIEIVTQAIEHLIESKALLPAKCPHGLLRAFDECDICHHATRSASPIAAKRSTAEVRREIWRVLSAHPDGLTRGELARLSGAPEKSVTWAIADWESEGAVRCHQ